MQSKIYLVKYIFSNSQNLVSQIGPSLLKCLSCFFLSTMSDHFSSFKLEFRHPVCCMAISFPLNSFTSFFSFGNVSQPFSGSDQYTRTFLQAFLDRKHFPQLKKLLNHHHRRRCNTSYV